MSQEAHVAEVFTFPTDVNEFDKDERISYSKLDNKYIAVQDDGTEYEFDKELRRWVPIIDEDLIQQQQAGYFNQQQAGDDEAGPSQGNRKRSRENSEQSQERSKNGNKRQKPAREPPAPKANTAVYVTGLPLDVTVEEVHELFSRKCGVIAEEIDSGRPRIKLYTDEAGKFKGDALVVFFKPQSVDMAIMLLDDTEFRWNSTGKMHVQAADTSYKKVKNENGSNAQQQEPKGPRPEGGFDPKQQGDQAKRRQNDAERQKIIKKTQKLSAKLADWDDDEPSTLHTRVGIPEVKNPSRWDKVVILSHMFTLKELEEDPAALLDIKEDIRDECEKLGEVTNVVLFDQEEDGIVSVKFKTPEAAAACVKLMHGRAFDGRVVEAYFATGRERFKKTKNKDNQEDEEGH